MSKTLVGIIFGALAGIIDVIPMLAQKLSWDANLSAFSFWVISGFLISRSNMEINPVLKGIVISFLVLIPCAILIGRKEPKSLIPISIMTLLLGGLLGFAISKIGR